MRSDALLRSHALLRSGLGGGTWTRPDGHVDSVQWVDVPARPAPDLEAVERAYFRWVPRLTADLIQPRWDSGPSGPQQIGPWPLPGVGLIRLGSPRVSDGGRRRERPIEGGVLARPGGELVFEWFPTEAGGRLCVAVVALRPRLPRSLYVRIQRRMHERSTFGFLREFAR